MRGDVKIWEVGITKTSETSTIYPRCSKNNTYSRRIVSYVCDCVLLYAFYQRSAGLRLQHSGACRRTVLMSGVEISHNSLTSTVMQSIKQECAAQPGLRVMAYLHHHRLQFVVPVRPVIDSYSITPYSRAINQFSCLSALHEYSHNTTTCSLGFGLYS